MKTIRHCALTFVLVTSSTALATTSYRGRAITQIRMLQNALDMYALSKGHYPAQDEGLQELVETSILSALPRDPWERPYWYEAGPKPVVRCSGPDGIPHTDDDLLATSSFSEGCSWL